MFRKDPILLVELTGGAVAKRRIQHPKLQQRKRAKTGQVWWTFRYWHDEILPDGTVITKRARYEIGPATGKGAMKKREAELARDRFLDELNEPEAAPVLNTTGARDEPPEVGAIIFGKLA